MIIVEEWVELLTSNEELHHVLCAREVGNAPKWSHSSSFAE